MVEYYGFFKPEVGMHEYCYLYVPVREINLQSCANSKLNNRRPSQRHTKTGNYEKVSYFSFLHFRNYASVESELINIHCKRQAYSS